MALIDCHFFSDALGLSTSMKVILPETANLQIGMKSRSVDGEIPVLYLLHGLSDDHSIWTRRTNIERYVASLGIAVVMPNAHRNWYSRCASGADYLRHIGEEIPKKAQQFFRISAKRELNTIAGLSMGGYGAWKIALNYPERFHAAASLSGVTDICQRIDEAGMEIVQKEWTSIFGPDWKQSLAHSENDIHHLLSKLKNHPLKPRLYQCCGTEDFLYKANQSTKNFIETLDYDYCYEEEPGQHEWGYWDRKIQSVLKWMA